MQLFRLSIISPDETLFEGEVTSVILPGKEGVLETLAQHAPLVVLLKEGDVVIRENDASTKSITISGGVYQFLANEGMLLTTNF